MRWGLAGGIFLCALVVNVGAAEPAGVAVPARSQLRLMPLPHASYGPSAASLSADPSSGWETNKESAENEIDPALTAAALTRMGRITGFDVSFADPAKASTRDALVNVESEVDLFRTPAAAARYFTLEVNEPRRFDGKQLQHGLEMDRVAYFAVPGLKGARGVHTRVRAGGLTVWSTAVAFRVGTLFASAEVDRTDERDVRADVRGLAAALNRRIHGVLAGKVHDAPLVGRAPKLGGLGRPAGGPDLAAMAIAPVDFAGRARPTQQGYVRNSDDIAAFTRQFGAATFGTSQLIAVKIDVELRASEKAASGDMSILASLTAGARGRKFMRSAITSGLSSSEKQQMVIGRVAQLKVPAGDRTVALGTTFTVNGLRFSFVYCVVQRKQVVETITALSAPRETIHLVDTRRLALTAVARIDQALLG